MPDHPDGGTLRRTAAGRLVPADAPADYDMHADAHRPMIEPDETIGEYGARCYAAGRDDAQFAAQDASDTVGALEVEVSRLVDADEANRAEIDRLTAMHAADARYMTRIERANRESGAEIDRLNDALTRATEDAARLLATLNAATPPC